LGGVGRGRRKRRARELLEVTGLDNRTYGRIHRLSGGEQQRLALCVALSPGPRLLLADEPTGELDTERSLEVYDLLRSLCHDGGLSVLVVTHDVALATRADRTVRLEDGRMMTERLRHGEVDRLAVDRRGRIQIPQDMLDQAGIAERVEAEATEEGIILRRPPDDA
ncbi:MAG: ATP-binding cassette domain-containing protein, partial [Acidimicrobiia bacterium]|nr:ATP-binding cassette domain-containing protein [Acidimicrobiia bacterium]